LQSLKEQLAKVQEENHKYEVQVRELQNKLANAALELELKH
jgi:hypothetical protein